MGTIELQRIDCNCSDCKFMIRNLDKFNESVSNHFKWQHDYFLVLQKKVRDRAYWHLNKSYDLLLWDKLLTESEDMKFELNKKECMINYGFCNSFKKDVSFIPNTCQIDTQNCFKHRKDAE